MLTCGLCWHLHCVDERQQIIVWTEIAGGITGAANGGTGIWSLRDGAAAIVALAGTGQGQNPFVPSACA